MAARNRSKLNANPALSKTYIPAAQNAAGDQLNAAATHSPDQLEKKRVYHKSRSKGVKNSLGGLSEEGEESSDRSNGTMTRSQATSHMGNGHGSRSTMMPSPTPQSSLRSVVETSTVPQALSPHAVHHYASVNFRFGSAWFLAPFRCQAGDIVVVEYPAAQSVHMGIVSGVTTVKPATFYSDLNLDPDYLSEDEITMLPRLLRHARPYDKQAKLALRDQDLCSLEHAQFLATEMGAPVSFMDAEWLLDGSAVTFLVYVYGDVTLVNQLADELATREGAEVVFTYPS